MMLGTISSFSRNSGATLTIDGESTATRKRYLWLAPYRPIVGDRVLVEEVGDQYIVLGKVTSDTVESALAYNITNRVSGGDDGYVCLGIKNGDLYFGLAKKDGSSSTMYKVAKA